MNSSSLVEELLKSIKTFTQQSESLSENTRIEEIQNLSQKVNEIQKGLNQLELIIEIENSSSLEIVHEVEAEKAEPVFTSEQESINEIEEVEEVESIEEKVSELSFHEEEESQLAEESENSIDEQQKELFEEETISGNNAVEKLEAEIGSLIDTHSSLGIPTPKSSGTSLADKLGKSAIADLTTAIGISEKFLFMNELFEGDSDSYKGCLFKLNQLNNFSEAKDYLISNITNKYNWDEENEFVQRFYEVVERRYI